MIPALAVASGLAFLLLLGAGALYLSWSGPSWFNREIGLACALFALVIAMLAVAFSN